MIKSAHIKRRKLKSASIVVRVLAIITSSWQLVLQSVATSMLQSGDALEEEHAEGLVTYAEAWLCCCAFE